MKFLANENIPLATVRRLRDFGHDVLAIAESVPGSTDQVVLSWAFQQQRILITFDRDYGELIYVKKLPCPSCVIYLRFIPTHDQEPAECIARLLDTASELLQGSFIVLDRDGYRLRPLPKSNQ